MAQEHSMVETFDSMSDFTWDDKWLPIVDMPDRKGEIDYEQESFRQSYNNYLKDVALNAPMGDVPFNHGLSLKEWYPYISSGVPSGITYAPDRIVDPQFENDPWFHPSYDSLSDCSEY